MKREELYGKYFATPTEGIWNAVIEMLKNAGFKTAYGMHWNGHADILGKVGPSYLCILGGEGSFPTGKIGYTSRGWFEESDGESRGYSEMPLTELADILAKPEHTLMTSEELNKRFDRDSGDEGALVLSIEKWERLMEDDNWSELVHAFDTYMRADTCGTCKLHLTNYGGGCSACPLLMHGTGCSDPKHFWCQAKDDVKRKDRRGFLTHAKELLGLMENALEELRRPKRTYRIGQWFQYHRPFSAFHNECYVLTLSEQDKRVMLMSSTGGKWSDPREVSNVLNITEEEFAKFCGSDGEFVPVDVEITVKGEKK